ncbi:MAG TPA: hypothetical protein VHP34_03770 [Alphaproteobacteria bacterium]|nr:hypothetical protein [Alphaproteobacteria bacterium]
MKTTKLAIVLIALTHLACAGVYFSGLITAARLLGQTPSFLELVLPLFLVFCSTGLSGYFAYHKRPLYAAVLGILPVLALAGHALYQHPEWIAKVAFPLTLFAVLVVFNLDVWGVKTKAFKAWGALEKVEKETGALNTAARFLAIIPTMMTLLALGIFIFFSWQFSQVRNDAMVEIQKTLQKAAEQAAEERYDYEDDE